MTHHVANGFFGFCTIMAQVFVGAVVVSILLARGGVPTGRRWLNDIRVIVNHNGLWLSFVVALTTVAGSLYYSIVRDLPTCDLCWFLRVLIYLITICLLVAARRQDNKARLTILDLSTLGVLITIFQIVKESTSAVALGFLTIPVMALSAFVALATLMLLLRDWKLPS